MDSINFKIEQFEGPLDLLLALISKNKMNIYEINILHLIEQYMVIIESAKQNKMEVASDFIEMAARLVQIKSYFLLPKSEESERLKQELTGLLIEYSLCKKVADDLRVMGQNVCVYVRQPMEIDIDYSYNLKHSVNELVSAHGNLLAKNFKKRQPDKQRFDAIVQAPIVSVTSRIIHVLRNIITGKAGNLKQLFKNNNTKSTTVATFLAVLELIRAGRITIEQDEQLSMNKAARKEKTVAEGVK